MSTRPYVGCVMERGRTGGFRNRRPNNFWRDIPFFFSCWVNASLCVVAGGATLKPFRAKIRAQRDKQKLLLRSTLDYMQIMPKAKAQKRNPSKRRCGLDGLKDERGGLNGIGIGISFNPLADCVLPLITAHVILMDIYNEHLF